MSSLDSCSQHEENITSDKIHELFPTFGKIEQPNQAAEERAAVLRDTIVRGQSDPDISPEILAELQSNLGDALCDAPLVERTEALQEAIACYKAALQIYTLDRYPYRHASIQNNLGNAYADLIAGERSVHQERAIECYEAALYVYTRDIFPVDWAMLQYNLASLYQERIAGDRATNLEQAIQYYEAALQIRTRDDLPIEWAGTQNNLGNAYKDRILGEPETNLERAIECLEAALSIFTRAAFPDERATVQNNLGSAYFERLKGKRQANLERAISCYEAALQVHTHAAFPSEWAMLQYNLGLAYQERIAGDPVANQECTIQCYEAALQVYTRNAFPFQWATLHNNLGNKYGERKTGEKAQNLERAFQHYEAALQVYTRESFSTRWATVQMNLGTTYQERIIGERRANLEYAIACFEAALQTFTHDTFPTEWATIQNKLGLTYRQRIAGERRVNIERAIQYYELALQIHTHDSFPTAWAALQTNLGSAYVERIEGEVRENIERAIAHYEAALQVYTVDTFPLDYAMVQYNLGSAYFKRVRGAKRQNIEYAIASYEKALQVYTRQALPLDCAKVLANLGSAYVERVEGERQANIEKAITYYEAASQVYIRDTFPLDYAFIQYNLGSAYIERVEGKRHPNLERAIAFYEAASQVYTCDAFPIEHRQTQIQLASVEAQRKNWASAHEAYETACAAEELLMHVSAGVVGRDIVLREGGNASTYNGFSLLQLGQVEAAALAIERGRARGLAEALALNTTRAGRINDAIRRKLYEYARKTLMESRIAVNTPLPQELTESERRRINLERIAACHRAQEHFTRVVAEIRAAQDPADFLQDDLDATTLLHAAKLGGTGHALVYLAATPWGGCAIAVSDIDPNSLAQAHFSSLELPLLTDTLVNDLVERKLNDDLRRTIGGLAHAQEDTGFSFIVRDWQGTTFREKAMALHSACAAASQESTLDAAIREVLTSPTLMHLVDQPIDKLSDADMLRLALALGRSFLQLEVQHCLKTLSSVIARPLVTWLHGQGVKSLTLIPCGRLAAFPLAAVPLADGSTVGEVLPTSMAPSARSLLYQRRTEPERSGVYALGNPHPTHQELLWGEAEAQTLVYLARRLGMCGEAKVQNQATRASLTQMLSKGYIVDASCHGVFDVDDFLQSSLLLARGKRLALADMLNHKSDLRGLRLLILSACQTAVLDLRGAINEVRSLAVGMVQAGAKAVLASLWRVDDKATYLLMVRFAQEWLPRIEQEPPAAALARAQHWLRTVTNRELQRWRATSLPEITVEERQQAGSVTPLHDPWEEEKGVPVGAAKRVAVRGRGNRYELGEAEALIHTMAAKQDDLDACPYADPIYWAGFQIMGW